MALPTSVSDKHAKSFRESGDLTKVAVDLESISTTIPLPADAATESKQDAGNALLTSIESGITGLSGIDFATEAKQDIQTAELESIDSRIAAASRDAGGGQTRIAVEFENDYSIRIDNAISSTDFNLNLAAYSVTSNITTDFILDHIEFKFSTTQERDITVTSSSGAKLYSVTGDTSLNLILEDIEKGFTANENFTISITQTAGACLVSVLATVKIGEQGLAPDATEVYVIHPDTTNGERVTAQNVNTSDRAMHTLLASHISQLNGTTTPLNNAQTFTGTWEETANFSSVTVALKTDQSGLLYVDFSPDGTNADSSLPFNIAAGINEVHRITVTRAYFRIRIVNDSGSNQTYLRAQSIFNSHPLLTSPLNSSISDDSDSIVTRSILYGQDDSDTYRPVPVSPEGHLEVEVHGPLNPFGSIHTENLRPVFQIDAVYQVNSSLVEHTISGSGTVTQADAQFSLSSGTTIFSQAVLQSRKRLRYRPGQGSICRFTALFTSPVASSYQIAGMGHPEDGYYFGYVGTDFGILHVRGGRREIQTLTISTASSTTESVTVTLNGTAFSVPVTNSGNTLRTAYEISTFTYTGWTAQQIGSTIVFISQSPGNKAGSFTLAGTTVVGAFAETRAGVATTDTFIPQSSWNGDKLDGTGGSAVTLDPTKGNIYQIMMQYLGHGPMIFQVRIGSVTGNNATWVTCHTINNPNALTGTHVLNPSFPFTSAVYSAGSTTNLTVKTSSFAGFIEGNKILHGGRFTYFNSLTTVAAVNYQALFSIKNSFTYAGKVNQSVINMLSVSGAVKHTSPVIYYLIRNGTLNGNVNFTSYDTNSCSLYDSAATTVTFSTNSQIIWTGHLGETGELDHHFSMGGLEELTLQPGEWVTLAAKSVTGSPAYVTGSINTREDQ